MVLVGNLHFHTATKKRFDFSYTIGDDAVHFFIVSITSDR